MTEAAAASKRERALLVLLAGALVISSSPILVRLADVGPIASGFWRVTLAIPVLTLLLAFGPRSDVPPSAHAGGWPAALLLLGCGAFFAGDIGCWHLSLQSTTVVNATLLGNFATVFVALFGWLVLGERLGGRFLLGLAFSLGGLLLLVLGKGAIGGGQLAGDLLGLLTGVCYAGYLITMSRLRVGHSVPLILLGTTVITSLTLLPIALATGEQFWPREPSGWLPLLGLAIGSQTLGQMAIGYALKHLPMSFSAVVLTIQPVIAAIAAWVLFGEAIGLLGFAGAALVLAGILLCRRG